MTLALWLVGTVSLYDAKAREGPQCRYMYDCLDMMDRTRNLAQ